MQLLATSLLCILCVAAGETTSVSDTSDVTTTEPVCKVTLGKHSGPTRIAPSIEKSNIALLLLLGFGGFSLLIAGVYKSLRKYIFHDEHSLDTVFDAGGRVSLSLTAVTVTSQLLWPADFLQMSTITSKSGMGGSLWTAVAVVMDILLFPALSLYLKTRAPGAKTFPQIAYARFGKLAHIIFCILALITNIIVSTSVMLAGKTAIEVLSKNSNNEFIFLILAVLFGSYCMIGGLGTTFYISYFNTALTFISISIYMIYTSFFPSPEIEHVSTIESMYNAVVCLQGPDGNFENSYLTFRTKSGLIYGVVIIFMATSISFCDQANWQSRIAAKPSQGVVGFFFAAYMWFVVPTAMSFTATMTYFTMSYENGTHLLTEAEIDNGYINPFVMNHLLGEMGGYLLLTMLMMALMSTGSGEVMAVSSIIVYDIYKTYINPFRANLTPTSCILCGCEKLIDHTSDKSTTYCECPSSIGCKACEEDIQARALESGKFGKQYKCKVHGAYRHYEDGLWQYKTWCMVWVVVMIVPYGLLISETGINVNWATLGIPVITSPFLWPLFLTITWSKATSQGVVAGGVVGLFCSIAGMLIMGSTYEGGLADFYTNTAQDYSLLVAMVSGFFISGIICFCVSLCTHKIKCKEDRQREWAKTINIDNPLNPFRLVYEEELRDIDAGPVITAETMDRIFRKAKLVACIGAGVSLALFAVVVPAVALSYETLSLDEFKTWIRVFQYWVFVGTILVVFVPPVEEGIQIWRKYKDNAAKNILKPYPAGTKTTDRITLENINGERL
ncbi:uncharacterized protein LOC123558278 [Mercenaria mercenaria]|uniref:uncharacterized protein LOC123558278 n=1 Tax=Mercenaria mercenaria TaxID=6596 RepID=UPI00234E8B6D|nr:uncharacterized protein LOC123558278 [Mercenaria mercenaria]